MSVVPFYRIDKTRAIRAPLCLDLRVGEEKRPVLCTDAYCLNPLCECKEVHLFLSALEGSEDVPSKAEPSRLLERMHADWEDDRYFFSAFLDPATAELTPDPEWHAPAETLAALRHALTPQLVSLLGERVDFVHEWRNENSWRLQDWTHLADATSASWHEVFPATDLQEVVHEGARYTVLDHYCIVPECRCRSVYLSFHRSATGPALAAVCLDTADRPLEVRKVIEGKPRLAHAIFRSFAAAHPDFLKELPRRRKAMRPFAALVEKQARSVLFEPDETEPSFPSPAAPDRPAAWLPLEPASASRGVKTPRNAPCPCGSGRKYKNCCGRGR